MLANIIVQPGLNELIDTERPCPTGGDTLKDTAQAFGKLSKGIGTKYAIIPL